MDCENGWLQVAAVMGDAVGQHVTPALQGVNKLNMQLLHETEHDITSLM